MEQVTKLASKLKLELKEQQEKYLTHFMDSMDDMRQQVIALKGELDAVYAPEISALRLDIQALQQGNNPTLTSVHPTNPLQMLPRDGVLHSTMTTQCEQPRSQLQLTDEQFNFNVSSPRQTHHLNGSAQLQMILT